MPGGIISALPRFLFLIFIIDEGVSVVAELLWGAIVTCVSTADRLRDDVELDSDHDDEWQPRVIRVSRRKRRQRHRFTDHRQRYSHRSLYAAMFSFVLLFYET